MFKFRTLQEVNMYTFPQSVRKCVSGIWDELRRGNLNLISTFTLITLPIIWPLSYIYACATYEREQARIEKFNAARMQSYLARKSRYTKTTSE